MTQSKKRWCFSIVGSLCLGLAPIWPVLALPGLICLVAFAVALAQKDE